MNDKIFSQLIFLVLFALPMSCAYADSDVDDRFSLSLGVFVTDRDTNTQLNGTVGAGTPTNLERDLGLDSSDNVFRVDGYLRFNERHRIDFSVFDLSRSNTKQIERDIQWGDEIFTISSAVDTDFDLAIYKAAYTYSFMRRDNGYLGATAGLYVADTKATLSEPTLGQADVGDITAPLPVIGLRGDYALSKRWRFRASGEFFFLEYEDIDGSLVDLYAGVDYRVLDHMSVGLGINSVSLDVSADGSQFDGAIDWNYTGGLVFLKFDF